MHTKNQHPRLSGSALKVPVWGGGVGLLSLAPTHVEVEMGCDNISLQSIGLFKVVCLHNSNEITMKTESYKYISL